MNNKIQLLQGITTIGYYPASFSVDENQSKIAINGTFGYFSLTKVGNEYIPEGKCPESELGLLQSLKTWMDEVEPVLRAKLIEL